MKEFACVECVYIGGQRAPTNKDISIFCEPERISANGYLFTADGDKYKRSPPESALPRGGSGGDPAAPGESRLGGENGLNSDKYTCCYKASRCHQ